MSTKNFTDQELVKLLCEGNSKAIDIIINKYKNKVYTYILVILKNKDLANDIFQETFIKVFENLRKSKYEDRGSLLSWIIRIAHNLIIDYFRKEKRIPTLSKDTYDYDILNSRKYSEKSTEDEIVNKQVEEEIILLLDALPYEQKQIVMLRFFGDLSFKEIAELTDVSINTALGRMRYALINIRRLIEKNHIILNAYTNFLIF